MQGDLFFPSFDRHSREDLASFVATIWEHYRTHPRPMPWRENTSPYWVCVSEFMLQQTQVPRVIEKFSSFVARFPDFTTLSASSFSELLEEWSGLGYNRRAQYLHRSATIITFDYGGVLPEDPDVLVTLPGVGPNTAGSIAAFAYNRPVIFIETNIRRVYLAAFFHDKTEAVSDKELMPLIESTLQRDNPREWYWALMDYGVALGRSGYNANRRSKHYTVQSPFEQSDRQLRGRILRALSGGVQLCAEEFPEYTGFSLERIVPVLERLEREDFLHTTVSVEQGKRYRIAD